jgi:hypothetical protein
METEENKQNREQLEKAELEKKYYSQKKEIRKKLEEATDALNNQVKEAEEDFAARIAADPKIATEEEQEGYKEYLEQEKNQIKKDIEMLEAHEQELELDYEDLKTEPKIDMTLDYAKSVNHSVSINAPLMKMVFDYFNYMNDSKEAQEKAKITLDCFLDASSKFMESFPHTPSGDYYHGNVMVNFKGITRVIISLKKFFEQGEFFYKMSFYSEGKTYLNPDYLSKKILFNAISHSKVKGSYITLPPNSIMWKQEKLERRGFSDIFLPKSNMDDLRLYTALHDKSGKLLRYLMIGNPGTGKTESTLAVANILKDKNVTIIKTMVCDSLKDKIELAELLAPSLVILDDIDLSLGSRKKGMISSGLAQFLDVLDGTEKVRKDVGFIATTNSLELLDMAAQRPGRFDKLIAFDSLTKSNIKNIILKSLFKNFDLESNSPIAAPYIHFSVVDKFFESRVTGAHIYNTVKMLNLRVDTLDLDISNITPEWIVGEIQLELTTMQKMRNTDYLRDTMAGTSKDIGFPMVANAEDDEEAETEAEYVNEPMEVSESKMSFSTTENYDNQKTAISVSEGKGYESPSNGDCDATESKI